MLELRNLNFPSGSDILPCFEHYGASMVSCRHKPYPKPPSVTSGLPSLLAWSKFFFLHAWSSASSRNSGSFEDPAKELNLRRKIAQVREIAAPQ